jgi:hypothetical protein
MAVLAGFCISNTGSNYVTCIGVSADSATHFGDGVNVYVDFTSATLIADIEAGLKTKLQLSPWNMTFASGDTVRLIPGG